MPVIKNNNNNKRSGKTKEKKRTRLVNSIDGSLGAVVRSRIVVVVKFTVSNKKKREF